MRPIRLSVHAKEQLPYRGIEEDEVFDAIRTSTWETAKKERLQATKNYLYGNEWNNKFYSYKQVKPVFVEEESEIVVITVYAYYFNKEVKA
ncbi:DUF4258 domain-containing protein [Candidatus Magnetominusculus xianensis]|uniref:DUF4258 domain-containing protein n=1 Tax=Candidatus Magnetominusculus xianensis TaxID=1748249 RepID=A0ABR5SJJ4_9BACT|nr:DUF4258 domain-containing protein [Candidatus Magnetominusculus xianensis]KWT94641.1 hypothetical protein ASN18_0180 [Candidatus Magnetominusculus xianensis]MBF0403353.1 DUF4258 domain-containing protein [Nitrospirota bacterium]